MNGPTFIAVVPAEVELYGAAAAIMIALIRYRTGTHGPGRIDRDGYRWWRVTHRDLAAATGLSAKATRTALKALDGVVIAKHFAPLANQSLAYRVAAGDDTLTSQLPQRAHVDLPVAPAGIPDAHSGEDRAPAGTPPRPSGHLHLSLETLEKGGEASSTTTTAEDPPPANCEPATPEPNEFGDALPENPLAVDDQAAPAEPGPPNPRPDLPTWVRGPYGPRCRRHANVEHPPNCPPCGEARIAAKAEDDAAEARIAADRAAARMARERSIKSCRRCDEAGWLLGNDGVVLDDAVRCDHQLELETTA